ncbi:hypothetical protein DOY81_000682, partial [Sarcophaga bullata]
LEMKGSVVSCCLFVLFLIQIDIAQVAEQKWYKTFNNKLYYIEENYEYTWFEALLQCSMKKLSLATLETQQEHNDLARILKEEPFAYHAPHLWIGAVGINRQFAWIRNSQPLFTNQWIPNNPDNFNGDEQCIHFWENTTTLNDRRCDLKYGYICEENDYEDRNPSKYKSILLNVINGNRN